MANEYILIAFAVIIIGVLVATRQRPLPPSPDLHDLVEAIDSLSKRVRELEAEGAADRGFIRQLEDRVYKLTQVISSLGEGVKILRGQLIHLGEVPEWDLPDEAKEWLNEGKQRPADPAVLLYQKIGESFSDDELRDLAFRLKVDYENLPGQTKRAKAQALVEKMGRLRRFAELLAVVRQLRPEVME